MERNVFRSVRDALSTFISPELKVRLRDAESSVRVFQGDIELAAKTQRSILPELMPAIRGYDIGAHLQPAQVVSGDFYDILPLLSGPDTTGIVLADVSGKGLPAAVYMSLTHGLLHAGLSLYRRVTPEKALLWLNLELNHLTRNDLYVAMLFGTLDTKNHRFDYARAGYERPFAIDAQGQEIPLPKMAPGQPLGMFDWPEIDTGSITLPPGATVFLYSDGATDETGQEDRIFGRERLHELLVKNRRLSSQDICTCIMRDIEKHQEGTPQYDDCTLMVLKRDA